MPVPFRAPEAQEGPWHAASRVSRHIGVFGLPGLPRLPALPPTRESTRRTHKGLDLPVTPADGGQLKAALPADGTVARMR